MKLDTTLSEQTVITAIARRACAVAADLKITYPNHDIQMDIAATHLNGCPLDLNRLLNAGGFDFYHDIFGIRRHLNRTTGKLKDFNPRFASALPEDHEQ